MSVVQMKKISILGLKKDRKDIISYLMKTGCVQIEPSLADNKEKAGLLKPDEKKEDLLNLEREASLIKNVISFLSKYDNRKKPLFYTKREIIKSEYNQIISDRENIKNAVLSANEFKTRLNDLTIEINRHNNLIDSLRPWEDINVPVDFQSTKKTVVLRGTIPAIADMEQIEEELSANIPESYISFNYRDKEQYYVFAVIHKQKEEEALLLLKTYGFSIQSFGDLNGTAKSNIEHLLKRNKEIEQDYKNIEKEISIMSESLDMIEIYYDSLLIEIDRIKAIAGISGTKSTFIAEGWVIESMAEKIKKHIEGKWTCSVKTEKTEGNEQYPVLLENGLLGSTTESITEMYSLPDSGEIDPNKIMAPFYILFFGLMLSDAGYGLIMAAACGIALKLFNFEKNTAKFIRLMFFCGISTVICGALFGGWFGDIIPIFLGKPELDIALWFNPLKNSNALLSYSLLLGVIHIYIGVGIKAANFIRRKKYLDALFDAGLWYVIFTGMVLALLPFVPGIDADKVEPLKDAGMYVFAIGAVLLILTQGRKNKNIFGKLFGGVASLYDLIGFLSDVLSYSRLFALGLVTSVIASVINEIAGMIKIPVINVIVFIAVFIIGHLFNLAINALGAYVHASRLQYIEFFGKFYKGGGKPFKPLKMNTKYIKIKEQEAI